MLVSKHSLLMGYHRELAVHHKLIDRELLNEIKLYYFFESKINLSKVS